MKCVIQRMLKIQTHLLVGNLQSNRRVLLTGLLVSSSALCAATGKWKVYHNNTTE